MNKFYFDPEKMENSPLRQHVKEKMKNLNKEESQEADNAEKTTEISLINGFYPIEKSEFHRIANQLTLWGVSSSGAVIKREGPSFVRMAVDITLNNLDKAKSPKAYFRGVLKKLQLS